MVSLYPIQSFKVEMTIIQGRNLIGKDRHFLTRQRTTSDPYIIASLGMDQRLGQTKTCLKTLNPVWDATFHFTVPNKRHAQVPTNMSTFVRNTNPSKADESASMIEACSMVLLKIYDEDKVTDDDMMGTLIIPIPVATRSGLSTTLWYDVDTLFVPNAVGQVQVALTVTPELTKGSMTAPNSIFPSPEMIARWTASVFGKKQQLNEHNLVVETETTDRKSYILAILKQMTT
jgi:C2 domain